jgi:hypothetical protein
MSATLSRIHTIEHVLRCNRSGPSVGLTHWQLTAYHRCSACTSFLDERAGIDLSYVDCKSHML